jgi:hypothetical protein
VIAPVELERLAPRPERVIVSVARAGPRGQIRENLAAMGFVEDESALAALAGTPAPPHVIATSLSDRPICQEEINDRRIWCFREHGRSSLKVVVGARRVRTRCRA